MGMPVIPWILSLVISGVVAMALLFAYSLRKFLGTNRRGWGGVALTSGFLLLLCVSILLAASLH